MTNLQNQQPVADLLAGEHGEWSSRVSNSIRGFTPILGQADCHFSPSAFDEAVTNILQNPNIISSHLFRADILFDSERLTTATTTAPISASSDDSTGPTRSTTTEPSLNDEKQYTAADLKPLPTDWDKSYRVTRSLVRRLIPRNPQLDRPLEQTCYFLQSQSENEDLGKETVKIVSQQQQQQRQEHVVVCIPHADSAAIMPWYHPTVKALAYLYEWQNEIRAARGPDDKTQQDQPASVTSESAGTGSLTVFYELYEGEELPLSKRLQRTAFHLLNTVRKHSQGLAAGYTKKFHHDLLISQARVQDTYSALKQKHAKRLCDAWVEVTEPSKHVFEDLAIAAFLIELWRDEYVLPAGSCVGLPLAPAVAAGPEDNKPPFPGFVDIGCGNGVLTEILLCEGFPGWGFDARRRKTWAILSPVTKSSLRELILIPQPLLGESAVKLPERGSIPAALGGKHKSSVPFLTNAVSAVSSLFSSPSSPSPSAKNTLLMKTGNHDPTRGLDQNRWHNGLFPRGTFIVSNHADELTAWTPLLASLSSSAFLAIPCCSHNLAGVRFRAPSAFTGFTADASAPQYFAREKPAAAKKKHIAIQVPLSDELEDHANAGAGAETTEDSKGNSTKQAETGDLKGLSQSNRNKQPSAYASLCDWVAFLADEIGFEVEKEMLRIPSTRNVGIVGRKWHDGQRVAKSAFPPFGDFKVSPLDSRGNGNNNKRDGAKAQAKVISSSATPTGGDDHQNHNYSHKHNHNPEHNRSIDPDQWALVRGILAREQPDADTWIDRATKLMSGNDTGQTVHG